MNGPHFGITEIFKHLGGAEASGSDVKGGSAAEKSCNSIGQIPTTMQRKRQPFAVPASPELGPLGQRISRLLSARADKSHGQLTTKSHAIVNDSS